MTGLMIWAFIPDSFLYISQKFEKDVISIFGKSIISSYLSHIELIFSLFIITTILKIAWMTFKIIVLVPTIIIIYFYIVITF